MTPLVDSLALAGSPVQWAIAAGLVVLVFAPQLLPPLGRLLGRMTAAEVRRRTGLSGGRPPVEVLPPERPAPTLRSTDPTPLGEPRPREAPRAPGWWVPAVVCALIGVILWILLHGR